MTIAGDSLPQATTSGARSPLSKRDMETLLRSAGGLSARQAKKMLAKGYGAIATDATDSEPDLLAERLRRG